MKTKLEWERKRIEALTREQEVLNKMTIKAEGSAHKQVKHLLALPPSCGGVMCPAIAFLAIHVKLYLWPQTSHSLSGREWRIRAHGRYRFDILWWGISNRRRIC